MVPSPSRFEYRPLLAFSEALFVRAGLPDERARDVAEILLEGDLMGHSTHGLALAAPYLRAIETGGMRRDGEPTLVAEDRGGLVWEGHSLPGPWLVRRAIEAARSRLAEHAAATVVIRRAHHIGCLQAYLRPVAESGLIILLTCSDPSSATVAPFGSALPLYSPNPLAAGWPTEGEPILVDISMSTTTNGMTRRVFDEAGQLAGDFLVDAEGRPTNDPAVLFAGGRRGAILPLGGATLGHKGFALGMLVEALTSGLAGFGRADRPTAWGASVFLQLIDPSAFGGEAALRRETGAFAQACRAAPATSGEAAVRLPGERAQQRRRDQLASGVLLHHSVPSQLRQSAQRLGLSMPDPMD